MHSGLRHPLFAEIIEYSSAEETAVCNLASIALPRFVREKDPHGREGKKLVGSLDADNRCVGGARPLRAVSKQKLGLVCCSAASFQSALPRCTLPRPCFPTPNQVL